MSGVSNRISTRPLRLAGVILALSVLAAACGSSAPPDETASAPFTADVECNARMAAAIDEWVARGVAASIVDLGGERQCVSGFGVADQETGRMNDVDTVFSIGSITKPITAAAIFDLIDVGVLTLDDTAGQHVAGLGGLAADSTIRNLLLHTTGIAGEHGFDHVAMTKAEAIAAIGNLEQASKPGSQYLYNNTNYSVLALIIDEVTEQGYRQYVVDEILLDRNGDPLDAGWWDGAPSPTGPRAWGYFGDEPAEQRGEAAGPHWAMDGNGAMAMSPLVMAEWTWAFFNEKILSPEATQLYLSTSTRLAGDALELSGWGKYDKSFLGVEIFTTSGGGDGIGHQMDVIWLPESKRVVVLARNALDYDVDQFINGVLPAFAVGTGIPTPPPIPEAPLDPASMAGTFAIGDAGSMTIEENDGALVVELGGLEALTAIYPVPDEQAEEVDRQLGFAQEKLDQALAGDLTDSSLRRMNRAVELFGPLQDAVIEGVFYEGRITVIANLVFRDETFRSFINTDILDITDFYVPLKTAPNDLALLLVYDEELGGFVERFTPEGLEKSILQPADDGVQIVNLGGIVAAERQD